MQKIIAWIKNHKLDAFLLIIVAYLFFRNSGPVFLRSGLRNLDTVNTAMTYGEVGSADMALSAVEPGISLPSVEKTAPPTTDVEERLVVQETNLSLVVKNVRETTDKILEFTEAQGGYMVATSLTQPEEAPYGMIVVRVPAEKLKETLDYFRTLSIKVSSEFVSGRDVTDEYEDIAEELRTLEKTKARFEAILNQAEKIDDILRVQREIISLQKQIDGYKGRQQLLEGTARLSRITLNISTDEMSLPYAPSETFRPQVIFKLAVRSLVLNLREAAAALIWVAVYAVVWIPIIAIFLAVKRFLKRRKINLSN